MKKKLLMIVLSMVFAFGATACGGEEANPDSGENAPAQELDEPTQTEKESEEEQEPIQQEEKIYSIGETWTVDGQWNVTVNSVEETADRNEFSDYTPAAVYLVTYTYENIGYVDNDGFMDGLYISMEDTIVDAGGKMGYSYPGDVTLYAQETPVGATCEAQACIGVDNAGTFKLYVDTYDGNGNEQKAVFEVAP